METLIERPLALLAGCAGFNAERLGSLCDGVTESDGGIQEGNWDAGWLMRRFCLLLLPIEEELHGSYLTPICTRTVTQGLTGCGI